MRWLFLLGCSNNTVIVSFNIEREKMSIINCTECEGQVSTTAKACPHCGAKDYREDASIRIISGLLMYIAEHGVKYLPLPVVKSIVALILALYLIGLVNLPLIIGYGILTLGKYTEVPNFLIRWSNWAVGAYLDFYEQVFIFLNP